jgi:diacylglycerol O-acyltransferase
MASYRYDRLSAQDTSFLTSEGPNTPMHVASVFIAEAGPLRTEEGGLAVDRLRNFIGSRLHLIPRYRQRIEHVPVTGAAIWVDDPHFSIDYHVRHTSLPRPGNIEQLKRLAGRIASQPLDRARPLWEIWYVEGLEGGEHFASIMKVHHCMIDGASGAELMTVLMSLEPDDALDPPDPPRYVPRPAPSTAELLRDEVLRFATGPFQAAGRIRGLLGNDDPVGELRDALRGAVEFLGSGISNADETPFNRPVGPHRSFEFLTMDLAVVKAVKDKLGGTINDIVLATVAGAVRRYLRRHRIDLRDFDFRVAAPVSVRSDEDATPGNRVSAWIVPLPLGEPDALTRLEHIRETTAALKQSKGALGADLLSAATEWTGTTLLSLGARLQDLARPHNMIVTNVPGPQIPLYILGARLLECYPLGPLFARLGLCTALFSYDGKLFWGFIADPDLVPDLSDLRDDISHAFEELRAGAGPARVKRRKKRAKRSG